MESLLPSEVARLVYGYLLSQNCFEAAQNFLENCPLLSESLTAQNNGRRISTIIYGHCLTDIIDDHCDTYCLVAERQQHLPESTQRDIRRSFGLSNVVRKLLDACQSNQKDERQMTNSLDTPPPENDAFVNCGGPLIIEGISLHGPSPVNTDHLSEVGRIPDASATSTYMYDANCTPNASDTSPKIQDTNPTLPYMSETGHTLEPSNTLSHMYDVNNAPNTIVLSSHLNEAGHTPEPSNMSPHMFNANCVPEPNAMLPDTSVAGHTLEPSATSPHLNEAGRTPDLGAMSMNVSQPTSEVDYSGGCSVDSGIEEVAVVKKSSGSPEEPLYEAQVDKDVVISSENSKASLSPHLESDVGESGSSESPILEAASSVTSPDNNQQNVHGMATTETSHHEFFNLMPEFTSNSLREQPHPESPRAVNLQDEVCSPQVKEAVEPSIKSRLRNSCKKKVNPEETESMQEPFLNASSQNLSYSISKDIIKLALEDCNLVENLAPESSQGCIIPLSNIPQEYHPTVVVPDTLYTQMVPTAFLPARVIQEQSAAPSTFILPPHNIFLAEHGTVPLVSQPVPAAKHLENRPVAIAPKKGTQQFYSQSVKPKRKRFEIPRTTTGRIQKPDRNISSSSKNRAEEGMSQPESAAQVLESQTCPMQGTELAAGFPHTDASVPPSVPEITSDDATPLSTVATSSKRKASSTPRRSHVRALDFATPTRSLVPTRQAATSPRGEWKQRHSPRIANKLRKALFMFRSQDKEVETNGNITSLETSSETTLPPQIDVNDKDSEVQGQVSSTLEANCEEMPKRNTFFVTTPLKLTKCKSRIFLSPSPIKIPVDASPASSLSIQFSPDKPPEPVGPNLKGGKSAWDREWDTELRAILRSVEVDSNTSYLPDITEEGGKTVADNRESSRDDFQGPKPKSSKKQVASKEECKAKKAKVCKKSVEKLRNERVRNFKVLKKMKNSKNKEISQFENKEVSEQDFESINPVTDVEPVITDKSSTKTTAPATNEATSATVESSGCSEPQTPRREIVNKIVKSPRSITKKIIIRNEINVDASVSSPRKALDYSKILAKTPKKCEEPSKQEETPVSKWLQNDSENELTVVHTPPFPPTPNCSLIGNESSLSSLPSKDNFSSQSQFEVEEFCVQLNEDELQVAENVTVETSESPPAFVNQFTQRSAKNKKKEKHSKNLKLSSCKKTQKSLVSNTSIQDLLAAAEKQLGIKRTPGKPKRNKILKVVIKRLTPESKRSKSNSQKVSALDNSEKSTLILNESSENVTITEPPLPPSPPPVPPPPPPEDPNLGDDNRNQESEKAELLQDKQTQLKVLLEEKKQRVLSQLKEISCKRTPKTAKCPSAKSKRTSQQLVNRKSVVSHPVNIPLTNCNSDTSTEIVSPNSKNIKESTYEQVSNPVCNHLVEKYLSNVEVSNIMSEESVKAVENSLESTLLVTNDLDCTNKTNESKTNNCSSIVEDNQHIKLGQESVVDKIADSLRTMAGSCSDDDNDMPLSMYQNTLPSIDKADLKTVVCQKLLQQLTSPIYIQPAAVETIEVIPQELQHLLENVLGSCNNERDQLENIPLNAATQNEDQRCPEKLNLTDETPEQNSLSVITTEEGDISESLCVSYSDTNLILPQITEVDTTTISNSEIELTLQSRPVDDTVNKVDSTPPSEQFREPMKESPPFLQDTANLEPNVSQPATKPKIRRVGDFLIKHEKNILYGCELPPIKRQNLTVTLVTDHEELQQITLSFSPIYELSSNKSSSKKYESKSRVFHSKPEYTSSFSPRYRDPRSPSPESRHRIYDRRDGKSAKRFDDKRRHSRPDKRRSSDGHRDEYQHNDSTSGMRSEVLQKITKSSSGSPKSSSERRATQNKSRSSSTDGQDDTRVSDRENFEGRSRYSRSSKSNGPSTPPPRRCGPRTPSPRTRGPRTPLPRYRGPRTPSPKLPSSPKSSSAMRASHHDSKKRPRTLDDRDELASKKGRLD